MTGEVNTADVSKRHFESFSVKNCPPSAFYIPEFLSIEEEQELLRNIYNAPKTKWTQLSKRRLQNWGGLPHPNGMITDTIPQWLEASIKKVTHLNIFSSDHYPNHVLINEYKPKEGIMPHKDGPLYFPTIATVNLGSHTVLDFYNPEEPLSCTFSLFLEPRSLLILQDDLYLNYLHGIQERNEDVLNDNILNLDHLTTQTGKQPVVRGTRISLTIRHVLKVSKFKIRL